MTKIYTRTGDAGETSLFGGERVRKDEVRIAACGTIDELNSLLGIARAELAAMQQVPAEFDEFLSRVQHELFNLGAELATPQPQQRGVNLIQDTEIGRLECAIDGWETGLEPLREFILPGGCTTAAQIHFARCVCRRAERLIVRLAAAEPVRGELVRYVNRLSDALFVLARSVNCWAGVRDTTWQRS